MMYPHTGTGRRQHPVHDHALAVDTQMHASVAPRRATVTRLHGGAARHTPQDGAAPPRERPYVSDGESSLVLDGRGRICACSPAAAAMFGLPRDALIGHPVQKLFPDIPLRDHTPGYNLAFVVFTFEDGGWVEFDGCDARAHRLVLDVSISPMRLEGRQGFIMLLRPAVAPDASQVGLKRLISSVYHGDDAVLITDAGGLIEFVNPAFESLTGFTRDDALGQTPRILKSGARSPQFYGQMWAALRRGEPFGGLFANKRKCGEIFFVDEQIRPFVDARGETTHFVSRMHDVSDHIRIHKRLNYLANHDGLTHLPNRNLFLDRLDKEIARATRTGSTFALLFIDLDDFKRINDSHGHAAGDQVLKTFGARLERCVREADTVARFGGDEFVLLLVDVDDRDGVEGLIDKIALLGRGIEIGEARVSVSLSIGSALFPADGNDPAALLLAADRAMYRVKAERKGAAGA